MKKLLLVIGLVSLSLGATAQSNISSRLQSRQVLLQKVLAIQIQIESLQAQKDAILNEAKAQENFSPDELMALINSSKRELPADCSAVFKQNNGSFVSTVSGFNGEPNEKKPAQIQSAVSSVSISMSDLSEDSTKLWSDNGNLIMTFNGSGALKQVSVKGNDGSWVSCPYEAPFHCPGCE